MLNWNAFETLSGAVTNNFEFLCRSLVRQHYGRFGHFKALANQPGVEFDLQLTEDCALGKSGQWFGWQCRWYGLATGTAIGVKRRNDIQEAIKKSEATLPGLTDWILWTRHPLTAGDQKWFYAIPTKMKLALWTSAEAEEHLSGPATYLREPYFGELILTPESLNQLHVKCVEPIKARWIPQVHEPVEAEHEIHRSLGDLSHWAGLAQLAEQIESDTSKFEAASTSLKGPFETGLQALIGHARHTRDLLNECHAALREARFESVRLLCDNDYLPTKSDQRITRYLTANRKVSALFGANILADMHTARRLTYELLAAINRRMLIVSAGAGCGKTQMSAQLTAPTDARSAGIFLRGKTLAARQTLDDLARQVVIQGKTVGSFEALVAAVDAAGQRQRTRLPIIIDGLNESEDPRDWHDPLASLSTVLGAFQNVQIVCTIRPAFVDQAIPTGPDVLEIRGFEERLQPAMRRYFSFFKIDATDADLPWDFLNHPLTLRIFCEVTNPRKAITVGVASMPGSLSTLFERYVQLAAENISSLSLPASRFYPAEITQALHRIGLHLWDNYQRHIGLRDLRILLEDQDRRWDQSLVMALENEGLLFREPGEAPGDEYMSLNYDALAGHVIATAVLAQHSGDGFDSWLTSPKTLAALKTTSDKASQLDRISSYLTQKLPKSAHGLVHFIRNKLRRSPRHLYHPLAYDIFPSLVALTPRRMNGKQVWKLVADPMREAALAETAFIDGDFLDQDTVSNLSELIRQGRYRHRELFERLLTTRSDRAHPLNAHFLHSVLIPMSISERDSLWTEWLRDERAPVKRDVERLRDRWAQRSRVKREEILRARWLMWTLSSTMRGFRDRATHGLHLYGIAHPEEFFGLTLESLSINDPYISERMLAASYGIAMKYWADPNGGAIRAALPEFAVNLVCSMLVPQAPNGSAHALIRDYALGIVSLAQRVSPSCIPASKKPYLSAETAFLPSPFPEASSISEDVLERADRAMHMDFENYTLGRLIPDRSNYDFGNNDYKDVKRQISWRVCDLGFSSKFERLDRMISESNYYRGRHDQQKVDRYGKKYSWIAFFEMYGVRFAQGVLSEHRSCRPTDADIDPSFPVDPPSFELSLKDIFSSAPTDPALWLSKGPTPDYESYLSPDVFDGIDGPWVLLQGYIEENAISDDRRIFTFLRSVLVDAADADECADRFEKIDYPGNSKIPDQGSDYYTFAGEIPWSQNFAADSRDANGAATPHLEEAFDAPDGKGGWKPGVVVEIPSCHFAWESYHSELNQVGGADVLAPALCEALDLVNHADEWDLFEKSGARATLHRRVKGPGDRFSSTLLYLREDLLEKYLTPNRTLLCFVWGERNFNAMDFDKYRSAFAGINYQNIHRSIFSPE